MSSVCVSPFVSVWSRYLSSSLPCFPLVVSSLQLPSPSCSYVPSFLLCQVRVSVCILVCFLFYIDSLSSHVQCVYCCFPCVVMSIFPSHVSVSTLLNHPLFFLCTLSGYLHFTIHVPGFHVQVSFSVIPVFSV